MWGDAAGVAPTGELVVDQAPGFEVARQWEVEDVGLPCQPQTISVKGRLRGHAGFWKEVLKASPYVLSTIEAGYTCPSSLSRPHITRETKLLQCKMLDLYSKVLRSYWRVGVLWKSLSPPMFAVPCQW